MGGRWKIQTIYAVYKGDKFIDEGTRYELAEKLGVKEDTIIFYASPANKKRIEKRKSNNSLIAIAIDKVKIK